MSKAWRNLSDINACAVGVYTAAGVLLTPAQQATAGITVVNTAGTIVVTGLAANPVHYVRFTPNFGAGMGSSEVRVTVSAAAELDAARVRWDAGGTWALFNGPVALVQPEVGNWSYIEVPLDPDGVGVPTLTFTAESFFDTVATTSFNCSCTDAGGASYRTLGQLREVLMRRLGFGNQILNPPPGVTEMMDSFLYEAQYMLYNRFESLRTERYFSWPLLAGVRLYGLQNNAEDCSKRLNPDKINWAGVVREGIWSPMIAGINPSLNTFRDIGGYPVFYAVRSCVEIWPAPADTEGSLVIKGNFGLLPFAANDDVCTVDDSLVFAFALSNAKAHYRQPDAQNYIGQMEVLLANLVAGTHTTRRYRPGRSTYSDQVYVQPAPVTPFT